MTTRRHTQPRSKPITSLAPEWRVTSGQTPYSEACRVMDHRVASIRAGTKQELIWLLQHPPLYTAGTSAKPEHLSNPSAFPVFDAPRGGQFTYHGPGQRVVYVMLDVQTHFRGDVRAFISALEAWVIAALAECGVQGRSIAGRIGIWVDDGGDGPAKIAALGLRIRHGISFHGLSINVAPDLAHYDGIVPCGLTDSRVTSLGALGNTTSMSDLDLALRQKFSDLSKQ